MSKTEAKQRQRKRQRPLAAPKELREPAIPPGPRTKKLRGGRLPATFEPRLLDSVDGRFTVVKILKERTARLQAETGADSFARQVLCERAIFMLSLIETREVNAIEKGQLDVGSYVQAVNALQGLLKTLGLDVKAREASLAEYVAQKDAAKEAGSQ